MQIDTATAVDAEACRDRPPEDELATLRARVALLEAAIDHMDQGLLMIDGSGKVPIHNKRVVELLELPEHLMIGEPDFRTIVSHQLQSSEFAHCDEEFRTWAVEQGFEMTPHRYVRKRPDGTVLEVRSVPLPGGGAVRTFTNVTEAVQQEERLRLAQAELIAAREKAEAGSRAKSDFLAAMSHEIRTPLNAVLGLATCLLECPLGPEERKMVQTIHDSGDSLLQILNDILDFSKLEAQQLTFEEIAFSPEILAANVVSIVGVRAHAKGLTVTSGAEAGVPAGLVGDAGRIRQVLLNLVSNAVKFTTNGSVGVRLHLRTKAQGLAEVEWAVIDTGIGISEEGRAKLFKDFQQADHSINRRFGGSGLGLAICKRIVEQMGGEIGVDSEPGKGSTFWFRLKLPIASAVASNTASDDSTIYETLKANLAVLGRPLRLLVVDDNATNRLVAGKMLSEFQPITNFACDGNEAITAVNRFRYDLVFMDMHMPELDGLAATRAIRNQGLAVPIVAFTANAFREDIDACNAAGMQDFVAKPVRRKELLRAILKNVVWHGSDGAERPMIATAGPIAPETASPKPAAVDPAAIAELCQEIGAEGVQLATEAFFQDAEGKLDELTVLRSGDDRAAIGRAAHAIKGAAATIGLAEMAEIAGTLERDAWSMDRATLDSKVLSLRRAYADARAALLVLLTTLNATEHPVTESALRA